MSRERVEQRWTMPFDELVLTLAHGQPGSFDFQEAQAIIEARAAYEAQTSAEETRRLRRAAVALAIVTAVMALATVGLAVAAFLSLE